MFTVDVIIVMASRRRVWPRPGRDAAPRRADLQSGCRPARPRSHAAPDSHHRDITSRSRRRRAGAGGHGPQPPAAAGRRRGIRRAGGPPGSRLVSGHGHWQARSVMSRLPLPVVTAPRSPASHARDSSRRSRSETPPASHRQPPPGGVPAPCRPGSSALQPRRHFSPAAPRPLSVEVAQAHLLHGHGPAPPPCETTARRGRCPW